MALKISDYLSTGSESLCQRLSALAKSLVFLFFTHTAIASTLTVTLKGELPEPVEKNILAYLGKLPTTELARSAFIYSAKDNTNKALQSLGYYQTDTIILIKEDPWQLIISITLHQPTIIASIDVRVSGEAKHDPTFITLINDHGIRARDKLHHGQYEALKSDLLSLALQRGYFSGELIDHNINIRHGFRYADITLTR
jgi:translocation and assembly module TamA